MPCQPQCKNGVVSGSVGDSSTFLFMQPNIGSGEEIVCTNSLEEQEIKHSKEPRTSSLE